MENLKRGLAYLCGSCDYRGERRRVLEHLYEFHLTVEELPYLCDACGFGTSDITKFRKHPKWYLPHMKVSGSHEMLPPQEPRQESLVAHNMMSALSREESAAFWESRRRAPKKEGEVPSAPTPPPQEKDSSIAEVPGLRKILPKPDPTALTAATAPTAATATATCTLTKEEKNVLGEFLCMEDLDYDELDLDLPEKRDIGTMTEMNHLTLHKKCLEQEEEIKRLRSLLFEHKINPNAQVKSKHKGDGIGEVPRVSRTAVSPPRPVLKSIVYQMPRQSRVSGERRPLWNSGRRHHNEDDENQLFRPDRSRSRH
ncbi:hypothetical protein FSP39_016382 [Pinctada imbricata]|uniref:C2H2-type domain-containing protein n=1 Tax=Pinctada imbricata TaxID=66713 RepID=A0AA88XL30_PINIB|nr:hypothetical protein FSP39_016382 [Pinctada imbricata]